MKRRPLHYLADLKFGDHVCHVFKTDRERLEVLAEFIQLSLDRGADVLRLTSAEAAVKERKSLREMDFGANDPGFKNHVRWITPDDTPLRTGRLDPDAMVEWWRGALSESLGNKRSGLHVISDMSWTLDLAPAQKTLLEYAAKVDEFIPGSELLAICQFDRRGLAPDVLLNSLRTHPIVILGRKLHLNTHYVAPDGLLGEDAREREVDGWIAGLESEEKTRSAFDDLNRRYQKLFEKNRDGLVLVDASGRIIDANQAYCDMLGYSLDELRRVDDFPKITPERWRAWEREEIWDKRLSRSGFSGVYEKEYIRKDGTVFPVELQVYAFFGGLGDVEYLWAVARDVTQRKAMATTLRQNEEDLRVTLRSIGDGVIATDTKGKVARMNPVAERLTGWSLDEARGLPLRDVFHIANAETREPCENPATKVLATGETVGLANHTMLIAKNGTERQIADSGAPIRDEAGVVTGVVLVFRDVTEQYAVRAKLERNETRYRELFEGMGNCVAVYEPVNDGEDFALKEFNQAAERVEGVKREEVINRNVTDVFPGVEEFGLLEVLRQVHKTGAARRHPVSIYHDCRMTGWRENHVYKLPTGEVVAVYEDATERKRAELRIKHLNQLLRAIRNVNQLITHEKNPRRLIKKACAELIETRSHHHAWIVLLDTSGEVTSVAGAGDKKVISKMKRRLRKNNLPPCCAKATARDGPFIVHSRGAACGDCPLTQAGMAALCTRLKHGKRVFGFITVSIDSEHAEDEEEKELFKEAADDIAFALHAIELEAKRKSHEETLRFQSLLIDQIQDRVTATDLEGRIIYVNQAECLSFGKRPSEFIGKSVESYGDDSERGATQREIIDSTLEKGQWRGEVVNYTSAGTEIIFDTRTQLVRDEKGAPVAMVGISSDITEKRRVDAEMRRLRNFLASIIDSMPSLLISVDAEGRITEWNRHAEKETSVPAAEAIGKSIVDVLPRMADRMNEIKESVRSREARFSGKQKRKIDGETRYEDVTIFPLISPGAEGAVVRVDDVTERVRLEEMMVQSEKMLSLDGLAAGMAHEINNPLGGMMQNAEVIVNRLTSDSPANEEAARKAGVTMAAIKRFLEERKVFRQLKLIRESGRRAADIVDNMLNFARRDEATTRQSDLRELLDKTVELAENDYDLKRSYDFRNVAIVREYDPDLPSIPCESGKLQQVFLNLLRNAAESMSESKSETGKPKKPRITLRASTEGDKVRVEVADNGPGIDDEVKRRLFEPFFTTKDVGKGTGLGLSVSYFIITEDHGGEMWVESEPGAGSTFVIRLPAAGKP